MAHKVVRAVRGAVSIQENAPEAIYEATRELLETLCETNDINSNTVISAVFTVTPDIDAAFPAKAARQLGWTQVPLLCAQEIPVSGALPRVIRVLLHAETERDKLKPVYLRKARQLRPDLTD